MAEPADTQAARGRKKHAKTDRSDAKLLRELLQSGDLPESSIPPEPVLEWRERVRLYKTPLDQRRMWIQRVHAELFQHGVSVPSPCTHPVAATVDQPSLASHRRPAPQSATPAQRCGQAVDRRPRAAAWARCARSRRAPHRARPRDHVEQVLQAGVGVGVDDTGLDRDGGQRRRPPVLVDTFWARSSQVPLRLRPPRTVVGTAVHRVVRAMVHSTLKRGARTYNDVLAAEDVPPIPIDRFLDVATGCARRQLLIGAPGLEFPQLRLPPNAEWVGPLLPARRAIGPDMPLPEIVRDPAAQVVVVSQGTVDNADPTKLMIPALEALAASPTSSS